VHLQGVLRPAGAGVEHREGNSMIDLPFVCDPLQGPAVVLGMAGAVLVTAKARGIRRAGCRLLDCGECVVGWVWAGPGESVPHRDVWLLLAHRCFGVDEHTQD
jgi:hypothetical protein